MYPELGVIYNGVIACLNTQLLDHARIAVVPPNGTCYYSLSLPWDAINSKAHVHSCRALNSRMSNCPKWPSSVPTTPSGPIWSLLPTVASLVPTAPSGPVWSLLPTLGQFGHYGQWLSFVPTAHRGIVLSLLPTVAQFDPYCPQWPSMVTCSHSGPVWSP